MFIGEPGVPGDAGLNGAPGEKGEPGMKGQNGVRGLRGFPGPPGINGSKGEPGVGIKGDPGLPAINGSKGEKGANGLNGTKGEKGAACNLTFNEGNDSLSNAKRSLFTKKVNVLHQRINNGDYFLVLKLLSLPPTGHMLILHSQSEVVPTCPDGFPLVATGYSFLQTLDSSFGVATQDLGSMGSCLGHFSTSLCAGTNCVSYWLASNTSSVELSRSDMSRTISRCSVCLLTSNILAVHSLKHKLPECPIDWNTLWNGYSFIKVSVQYF